MNLLITGATGFLGGAVLAKVLLDDKPVSLLLLVRSDNSQNALARIKRIWLILVALKNIRKINE